MEPVASSLGRITWAVPRRQFVVPAVLLLLGVSGLVVALMQLQFPRATLLNIRAHAPYPQKAVAGTITVIYAETGSGPAAVFPFQVQYSVDGVTHALVDYSSHTIAPVGANVTVAYDAEDPAKATMVGYTPAPKSTLSSSARAAWDVVAVYGVALAILGLVGVGAALTSWRRGLRPVAPEPPRPFYDQDGYAERRLRALQRRARPPTRSELVRGSTLAAGFVAFSVGIGVYSLVNGGGRFDPASVVGVVILLAGFARGSVVLLGLRARVRTGATRPQV
jgi:hypothetical protein